MDDEDCPIYVPHPRPFFFLVFSFVTLKPMIGSS